MKKGESRVDVRRREVLIAQSVWALDQGDLDVIDSVLIEALSDPLLDEMINQVNQAIHAELFEAEQTDENPFDST